KNKDVNDVYGKPSFQCRLYDKVELDMKNIPSIILKNKAFKPLAMGLQGVDSANDVNKYLPVYLSESFARYYRQNNPTKERYDYESFQVSGNPNQTLITYLNELYKNLNIYSDNIQLLKVNFASP